MAHTENRSSEKRRKLRELSRQFSPIRGNAAAAEIGVAPPQKCDRARIAAVSYFELELVMKFRALLLMREMEFP